MITCEKFKLPTIFTSISVMQCLTWRHQASRKFSHDHENRVRLFINKSIGTTEKKILKMFSIALARLSVFNGKVERIRNTDVTRRGQNKSNNLTWENEQRLPHQLEAYAQMIPKVEVVQHVNNVVRSVGVLLAEFVENAHFDQCLMMESLFVANDFDCDVLISFVVQCANHLTETALSNHFQNLVAITNVIVNHLQQGRRKSFN